MPPASASAASGADNPGVGGVGTPQPLVSRSHRGIQLKALHDGCCLVACGVVGAVDAAGTGEVIEDEAAGARGHPIVGAACVRARCVRTEGDDGDAAGERRGPRGLLTTVRIGSHGYLLPLMPAGICVVL